MHSAAGPGLLCRIPRLLIVLTLTLVPPLANQRQLRSQEVALRTNSTAETQLHLADGRSEKAGWVRWESPDHAVFEIAGVETQVACEQMVEWGTPVDALRGDAILLRSGSLLAVADWAFEADRCRIESGSLGTVVFDRAMVRGVARSYPSDLQARDRLWRKWLVSTNERDQVTLVNGDTLTGRILGWLPSTETSKPNTDPPARRLRVELMRGEVTVVESTLKSLLFRAEGRAAQNRDTDWGLIGLTDGSLLRVSRLSVEQDQIEMRLHEGVTVRVAADVLATEIAYVQPYRSKVTYLSDLSPLGYKHVPFLTSTWQYQTDGNVLGAGLRSAGRLWNKGLGMHSTSRLAYDLGGQYGSFQAELALDDAAGNSGSVQFRVYAEAGDGQWKPIYTSPVIRGGNAPTPITVDVTDVRQLALIVDAADHGDQRDYANWLNARLLKATQVPR